MLSSINICNEKANAAHAKRCQTEVFYSLEPPCRGVRKDIFGNAHRTDGRRTATTVLLLRHRPFINQTVPMLLRID